MSRISLAVYLLATIAGCAHDVTVGHEALCRIQLGSTPATASDEQKRQDALAARAALVNSSARHSALAGGGTAGRVLEEILWECERVGR